jgi:hypothetical protein
MARGLRPCRGRFRMCRGGKTDDRRSLGRSEVPAAGRPCEGLSPFSSCWFSLFQLAPRQAIPFTGAEHGFCPRRKKGQSRANTAPCHASSVSVSRRSRREESCRCLPLAWRILPPSASWTYPFTSIRSRSAAHAAKLPVAGTPASCRRN